MSETSPTTPALTPAATPTPTVYFIDDSATMREVIKIAFRRENINVITCHDAATALAQIEQTRPDIVISDVIMPDQNGFEVCQHIKQHAQLGQTPVILMSGVVNRSVAEKAMAVKADDLIRKPFQPHELIARVKHLLNPNAGAADSAASAPAAESSLSSLFAPIPAPVLAPASSAATPRPQPPANAPRAPLPAQIAGAPAARTDSPSAEAQKLRVEVLRLENLIKKLRAELEAERQYCKALEAHIKTLQEAD